MNTTSALLYPLGAAGLAVLTTYAIPGVRGQLCAGAILMIYLFIFCQDHAQAQPVAPGRPSTYVAPLTFPSASVNIAQAKMTQPARPETPGAAVSQLKTIHAQLTPWQREGIVITNLLRKTHGLEARIDVLDSKSIVLANNFVAYCLSGTGTLLYSDVARVADDLAREIFAQSRKGQGDPVTVNVLDTQPQIVLQVSRPAPKPLHFSDVTGEVGPMAARFGLVWDGGIKPKPMILNFGGHDCQWVTTGFIGQPRSGKSTVMLWVALLSLLESTDPGDLMVWIIDTNELPEKYNQIRPIPHVNGVASSADNAVETLRMFADWCDADKAPTDGKHRLLVIDELPNLLLLPERDEVLGCIKKIAAAGGKHRLRLWLGAQNPDAHSYPSVLKPLTSLWVCCAISNDKYVNDILKIRGARKLGFQSEALIGANAENRMDLYRLGDGDVQATIDRIVARWGEKGEIDRDTPRPANAADPAVVFPREKGPLNPAERAEVRRLAKLPEYIAKTGATKGQASINALIGAVYVGGVAAKTTEKCTWIKEALAEIDQADLPF